METYLFLLSVFALIITVYMLTYSLMAVGVAITLVGMAVYVAELMESPLLPSDWNLAVVPVASDNLFSKWKLPLEPARLQEVFFVAGNRYTYDEAPAVCAVYNAEVATYDQVVDAHAKGADWCGYGWTIGGMALFPTQDNTWKKLQQETDNARRTRCGRPGINGGYFDPNTKFGVNCYGIKPGCNNRKYPIPIGSDIDQKLVDKLKRESGKIKVDPFNRNGWSMWGML
jgi:hypothetical protein